MDRRASIPAGLTLDEYIEQVLARMPTSTLTYRETWALKLYITKLKDKRLNVGFSNKRG